MYMEDVCTIHKTDDGKFIVNVKKKMEKKESKGDKPMPTIAEDEMKHYVAADEDELVGIIKEHVSSKGKEKTSHEKFDKGWKKD